MKNSMWDVVIIGGGASGLSAALVLGRSRRKVLVIDAQEARNQVTRSSHGFLTRDGISPGEFKQISVDQLKSYPNVVYRKDRAVDVKKEDSLFKVATEMGSDVLSKRVIFATGMKEELPDIRGLQEVYGTSVFPCPYCDGWERREEPLAIFGNEEWLMSYIKLICNWSQDVMIFTNGPAKITKEEKRELMERNIPLIETPIECLQSTDGRLEKVITATGDALERSGGFLMDTGATQASRLPAKLGIGLGEMGEYHTQEGGESSVKGMYIIGDAKNTFSGLMKAASEGYEVGASINHELVLEEW